jgi:HK97 family phage major capsid protein
MNSSTTQAIRTLKDSSTGQYLWSPGLLAGKDDTLLGKPLYNINTIPNMVAGNRIVAYADLNSCYQIVDRKGVNVQEDPYTNKPYVIFSVTKGVGGAITDPNGIKILAC